MSFAIRIGFCSFITVLLVLLTTVSAKADAGVLAVHAVRVQQFEDHLPRSGATVTLIEFETDVCENLTDADFIVTVTGTQATIAARQPLATCASPQRKQFHASTGVLPAGQPITILNPLLIDALPPAE